MKTRTMIALFAGGIGYVLGARAGRVRYDQIRRMARSVVENPRVRQAAHVAQEKVEERAPDVKERVTAAAGKVRHHGNGQSAASGWPPDPRSSAQEPTPTDPRTDL